MRYLKVNYQTVTVERKLGDKVYIMETIRDLDEAIELVCAELSPEEQMDTFAEDLCPYFGILWPAAEGLSHFLQQHPELVKEKSVLELGCGLGFPSLVAAHLGGQVLATDFHPDVESYFQRNCRHSGVEANYLRLNWRDSLDEIGKFDLVMGSDVLYEGKHPREVVRGLIRFLSPGGKILLSDPGRVYLQTFVKAMNDEGYREELHPIDVESKGIYVFLFSKS